MTATSTSPTAPATPALLVEVTATITLTSEVDLPTYYAAFDARGQAAYADLDLHEYGGEEEWQRPIIYLYTATDDACGASLLYGPGGGRQFADVPDSEARVRARGTTRVHGVESHWTEDDYRALCAAVPWLAARAAELDDPDEDLAWPHLTRRPGPGDVPLIGG